MSQGTEVVKVVQGANQTLSARFYHGHKLIAVAAGGCVCHAGDSTADPQVGATQALAGAADDDYPVNPVALDMGVPQARLRVEVSGAGNYVLVHITRTHG